MSWKAAAFQDSLELAEIRYFLALKPLFGNTRVLHTGEGGN